MDDDKLSTSCSEAIVLFIKVPYSRMKNIPLWHKAEYIEMVTWLFMKREASSWWMKRMELVKTSKVEHLIFSKATCLYDTASLSHQHPNCTAIKSWMRSDCVALYRTQNRRNMLALLSQYKDLVISIKPHRNCYLCIPTTLTMLHGRINASNMLAQGFM